MVPLVLLVLTRLESVTIELIDCMSSEKAGEGFIRSFLLSYMALCNFFFFFFNSSNCANLK